jgi:hypothetical protein
MKLYSHYEFKKEWGNVAIQIFKNEMTFWIKKAYKNKRPSHKEKAVL